MKLPKTISRSALLAPLRLSRARARAQTTNERLLALDVRLQEDHLRNTRVLPNRNALLTALPVNGTVAEVGVADGQVEIHRGMSWDVLEAFPDHCLDWVCIDAAHDYDSVKKDLEVARRKTTTAGYIAGHDYVRWGRFGTRFGVLEAVNEFCLQHRYEMAFLTLESDLNWSYALRKMVQRASVHRRSGPICCRLVHAKVRARWRRIERKGFDLDSARWLRSCGVHEYPRMSACHCTRWAAAAVFSGGRGPEGSPGN